MNISCSEALLYLICPFIFHASEDIVAADQLPETGAKTEHPFGFSILTAERTYELFTYSYQVRPDNDACLYSLYIKK